MQFVRSLRARQALIFSICKMSGVLGANEQFTDMQFVTKVIILLCDLLSLILFLNFNSVQF